MNVDATKPTRYAVRYLARDDSLNVVHVAGNRAAEALFSDRDAASLFCEAVKRSGGLIFEIVSRAGGSD